MNFKPAYLFVCATLIAACGQSPTKEPTSSIKDSRYISAAKLEVSGLQWQCNVNCTFDAVRIGRRVDPEQVFVEQGATPGTAFSKGRSQCTNLCAPGSNEYWVNDQRYRRENCKVSYCTCNEGQQLTKYYFYVRPRDAGWKKQPSDWRATRQMRSCNADSGPQGPIDFLQKPLSVGITKIAPPPR